MSRVFFALVSLSVVTFTAGCNKGQSTKPAVISSEGTFMSPDGRYRLKVELKQQLKRNMVLYSVSDARTDKQLGSDNAGSNLQRWFFFWDDSGNLWVWSSDIGLFVWLQNNGSFDEQAVEKGSKLDASIPAIVKSNMPSSAR